MPAVVHTEERRADQQITDGCALDLSIFEIHLVWREAFEPSFNDSLVRQ